MSVTSKAALPLLVAASLLAGCATRSDGSAPLNQRTWPICSLLGGLAGGGLGAIEEFYLGRSWRRSGRHRRGLICYAQDGDEDGDGIFDRRDHCPDTPPTPQSTTWGAPEGIPGSAACLHLSPRRGDHPR